MENSILHIFLKNPVLGKVKTRLARDIGDAAALEVYLDLVETTRSVVKKIPVAKTLWFDTFLPEKKDLGDWGSGEVSLRIQEGQDLGEKMRNSFLDSFKRGCTSSVLIGSDCPELQEVHLREAFRLLEEDEVVFGPALDGGYYLIGLKEDFPDLFREIPWSSESVFAESRKRTESAGKRIGLLEALSDLDDLKDLKEAQAKGLKIWRTNS
ncbi:glycosyltransferase [Leptospira fletcheri]|uniref:Glycosyltransferase n=1 Tax=Leptospira fletcheri TaxID=2484981 RepID=A0A4R9GK57_9LEPT|nr:TIGR04282 family arsenosugar biosynthesis glycosyltransferase [Leptospira fletcheri]TGK13156.1 glycosyltransferase [Leptospira fletcheri]